MCLPLTLIDSVFQRIVRQKSLLVCFHKDHRLSSRSLRVRYQLSIIQRTSCLARVHSRFPLSGNRGQVSHSNSSSPDHSAFQAPGPAFRLPLLFLFLLSFRDPLSNWECKGNRSGVTLQTLQQKNFISFCPVFPSSNTSTPLPPSVKRASKVILHCARANFF